MEYMLRCLAGAHVPTPFPLAHSLSIFSNRAPRPPLPPAGTPPDRRSFDRPIPGVPAPGARPRSNLGVPALQGLGLGLAAKRSPGSGGAGPAAWINPWDAGRAAALAAAEEGDASASAAHVGGRSSPHARQVAAGGAWQQAAADEGEAVCASSSPAAEKEAGSPEAASPALEGALDGASAGPRGGDAGSQVRPHA